MMQYSPYSYSSSDSEGFSDDNDYYEFKQKLKASRRREAEIHTEVDNEKKQLNAIFSAISFGNKNAVFQELNKGLDVDVDLENGWTPLLLASTLANEDIISGLLVRGANVNRSRDHSTPLMLLCSITPRDKPSETNILPCVKLLVEKNADVNAKDKKRRDALMLAASNGRLEIAKFLLPLVNKEAEDNQRWNALFWAVDGNHLQLVEFLLSQGFNSETKDIRGNTVADLAHSNGFQEILDLLPKDPFDEFYSLLNNNDNFEDTFKNLKPDQKPQFFSDICKVLYGTKSEHVVTTLHDNNISLIEFLSMTDSQLLQIGVQFPYQRARIIEGLYKFHKHPFKPQSIPVVRKNQIYTNIDISTSVLTCVKQLISMEASLRFIMNNNQQKLTLPETKEVNILISRTRQQIIRLEKVIEELTKKTHKWDETIKPADRITKKRINIPWSNLCLVVGVLSLFVYYKFK